MSIERVRAFFRSYGIEDRIQELDHSSATVALAAEALGTESCRIAKTLSFLVDGSPILIVAAGDARVNNAKYKAFFGAKAKMLTPEEAVELIGHAYSTHINTRKQLGYSLLSAFGISSTMQTAMENFGSSPENV